MDKLDLAKKYKGYYKAKQVPETVVIGPAQFLSLLGKGDPSGKGFAENLQVLYATAYTIKFIYKDQGKDFVVPKLECLWWFDEGAFDHVSISDAPKKIPRSEWEYRLLLRMPEYVTGQVVEGAKQTVIAKKQLPLANEIALYDMEEGMCVQMLHVGPFDTEPETLKVMQKMILGQGFEKNGHHHEIYLSDFRKTSPDKLKTILREPVK